MKSGEHRRKCAVQHTTKQWNTSKNKQKDTNSPPIAQNLTKPELFSKNGFVFAQFLGTSVARRETEEKRAEVFSDCDQTCNHQITDHWYHGNYWNEMIEFQILSYLSIANKYLHINLQNAAAFKNSLSIKQENFSNLPCWEYLFHSFMIYIKI